MLNGELERVLGSDKLARPSHAYGRNGRDPSSIWDAWFEQFSDTDRRRLIAFTDSSGRGISPDDLATTLGVSVDEALIWWRTACMAELASCALEEIDVAEWEAAERCAPLDIFGPQEIADLLGLQVNTVHVWRKRDRQDGRGRLPTENMTVSGVPIWMGDRVREWAEESGRLPDVASF